MYDGDFKVLAWLPFPSDVLPAPLLKAWCVTAKALPDISAISALIAVKHGALLQIVGGDKLIIPFC